MNTIWSYLVENTWALALCVALLVMFADVGIHLFRKRMYKVEETRVITAPGDCVWTIGVVAALCYLISTTYTEYPSFGDNYRTYALKEGKWSQVSGKTYHRFMSFDGYSIRDDELYEMQVFTEVTNGKTVKVWFHIEQGNLTTFLNQIGTDAIGIFSTVMSSYMKNQIQKAYYTPGDQVIGGYEARLMYFKEFFAPQGVSVDRVEVF